MEEIKVIKAIWKGQKNISCGLFLNIHFKTIIKLKITDRPKSVKMERKISCVLLIPIRT